MAKAIPEPPPPIDASYQLHVSIACLPASTPIEEILVIIERDGGVILTDFATEEELNNIDIYVETEKENARSTENSALHIIPKETLAIPGLVGKSPTVAKLCEHPILDQLRERVLQGRYHVIREDIIEENTIDPLLSISIILHTGFCAPRQRCIEMTMYMASDTAEVSVENGATMFVPGSHKWDDERVPRTDEVCFAEMQPGSALISLRPVITAAVTGHNSAPGDIRKVHGLFFIRGTMRTEENQFPCVPRSKVLKISDKMLSLLGYKKPTSVLGIVENEDPSQRLASVLERANQ